MALRAGSVGLRREACGREVGWRSVAAPPSLLPFARGWGGWRVPAKPDRGASVRGRAQLGRPPRSPGSAGDQQPT